MRLTDSVDGIVYNMPVLRNIKANNITIGDKYSLFEIERSNFILMNSNFTNVTINSSSGRLLTTRLM